MHAADHPQRPADLFAKIRELQIEAIEATWPATLRERLRATTDSESGDDRIFAIWRKTFRTGLFDPLMQFLDPATAAVDVGALLGQYSLTLAAFSTRCLCIEPLDHYAFMARTLPPRCIWRTVAAGEMARSAEIASPVEADGSVAFGLSSLVANAWREKDRVRKQQTQVRPLDELIPESLGSERVGFIKIDVEGYELNVLRGARETLRRHRPNVLIETDDIEAVDAFMAEHGYRGLFFFRRKVFDLSQYRPEIHRDPNHTWSPERAGVFDPERVMSDLYFIPRR